MTWAWDVSHFPHRVTAALADVYCQPAMRGFNRGCRRYGLAIGGWEVRTVDGFVLTRTLETIPRTEVAEREDAAIDSLATRRWLLDATRWYKVHKPQAKAVLAELANRNLGSLDDAALADHVSRLATICARGVEMHFELHLADMLPLGRLLVAAGERGISASEVVNATQGLSPASGRERREPYSIVGRLDVDAPTAGQVPAVSLGPPASPEVARPRAWGDALLDGLMADVVATFGVRDDNAGVLLAQPIGLLRHALLEAGRRLEVDALEATADEACALLRGEVGPTGEELQRRASTRAQICPVPTLVVADDDADVGTPGRASLSLTAAMLAYDALYEAEEPTGIGTEVVRGDAVVVTTPDEAAGRVGPNSVLVTRTTAPAFDALMSVASALVCEEGGPLSHAALAARELGLSAVVGLKGATATIPDGSLVEVDPVAGTVRVI